MILFIATIGPISANAQEWQVNFDKAKEIAKKEDRKIILVFQGSDWCAPCIKLEREVWNTEEFQTYAKKHFVMLQADFPRKQKNKLSAEQEEHNRILAERYNKNGYFPFVVVMNEEGEVIGETSYQKISPSEYISLLESFKG